MIREELGTLTAFVAVAERGSFTKAAGQLGTSQSALSHKIRRLEERLGVRLLTRTTRSVSLTEAGAKLARNLRPALEQIESQLESLTASSTRLAGTVRISSADHVSERLIWPALRRVLPNHPDVTVEVNVENRMVDIVAEKYDAGVRLGANVSNGMIAVPIGPEERFAIVASPAYFRQCNHPTVPEHLFDHPCIRRRLPTLGGFSPWQFTKEGQPIKVRVTGQIALNCPKMIRQAALDGFGLACLLESQVIDDVESGVLTRVLEDYCLPFPGYHLYYPSRRQHSSAFELILRTLRLAK